MSEIIDATTSTKSSKVPNPLGQLPQNQFPRTPTAVRIGPPQLNFMANFPLSHYTYHYNPVTEPFSISIIWICSLCLMAGCAWHIHLAVTEPPRVLIKIIARIA